MSSTDVRWEISSGEASPTIYSCYVNFLELMVCKNNQFLKKWIIIELSLTIHPFRGLTDGG